MAINKEIKDMIKRVLEVSTPYHGMEHFNTFEDAHRRLYKMLWEIKYDREAKPKSGQGFILQVKIGPDGFPCGNSQVVTRVSLVKALRWI